MGKAITGEENTIRGGVNQRSLVFFLDRSLPPGGLLKGSRRPLPPRNFLLCARALFNNVIAP